jgi:hypothetical protein
MLLSRASQAPDRIDPALLDAFVSQAPGGIDLLASTRDCHAFDTTSADAVLRMVREDRLQEQGNVSRNMVEEFSWDRIARQAAGQYEKVLRAYGQNG